VSDGTRARFALATHLGAVAGYAGLSDKAVGAIRRSSPETPQLNTRTGADGRLRANPAMAMHS
jgi:hypothetical protein